MRKQRQALDAYDDIPIGMKRYFRNYGWNVNAKLYEYAQKALRDRRGSRIPPMDQQQFDDFMARNGVTLENDMLCNGRIVLDIARARFSQSSLEDEQHLARYVKDVIDDPDAAEGETFDTICMEMTRRGIPIDWDEMT